MKSNTSAHRRDIPIPVGRRQHIRLIKINAERHSTLATHIEVTKEPVKKHENFPASNSGRPMAQFHHFDSRILAHLLI
jgi:hypothetical protein